MVRLLWKLILFSITLPLLSGCVTGYHQFQSNRSYVNLSATPFFAQSEYQCGPAALATVLASSGISITPQELVDKVYIPEKKGSLQVEMIAAARFYGRIPYLLNPEMTDIIEELHRGRPVLVFQNLGWRIKPFWHYAVVTGYDPETKQVTLRSGTKANKRLTISRFLSSWQRAGSWALVALKPGEQPANVNFARYFQAVTDMQFNASGEFMHDLYLQTSRQFPDKPIVWFALANSFLESERYSHAVESYFKVLKLDDDHIAANNNLAYGLSRLSCHEMALEYALKAVRLSERTGRFELQSRDTLSQIRARMADNDGISNCRLERGWNQDEFSDVIFFQKFLLSLHDIF